MGLKIATDIGGTFTDLAAIDEESGRVIISKSASTPDNFVKGVMDCIKKANLAVGNSDILIHGSTVAINIVMERKGSKVGLVTTKNFTDVYEIGRGGRIDIFDILYNKPVPLVPRSLRKGVTERVASDGSIISKLDLNEAEEVLSHFKKEGVESVAVCFINSYVNHDQELEFEQVIKNVFPEAYVSVSHQISREWREYERTSTTCVNAYIKPKVARYISDLERSLNENGFNGTLLIMQSNGGVMAANGAAETPVYVIESGPAAGVVGTSFLTNLLGYQNSISFDMGGTTAKVCLVVNGVPSVTNLYRVGGRKGQPIMTPSMDLVEIGAGGGSVAWVDIDGALKVGPQSSGAEPGPVCYGKGGTEPTVTDANLLARRINPENYLGGEMHLDLKATKESVVNLSRKIGLSLVETVLGIIKIADTHMLYAARAVSIQRGYD